MSEFRTYDESDAPEAARPVLAAAKKRMGFVTTLNGVMAESPELLAGYNALAEQFGRSSLPAAAKQVVLITASVANGCEYCVAAHSTLALRARVPAEVVEPLRAGRPLADEALEAVRRLTQAVVTQRGWVAEAEIEAFLAAGHTRRHVLDIVLGVGMKTLSNYTNHIASTPLDPAWADQAWTREQATDDRHPDAVCTASSPAGS
ncbi:carboxymuconolactone decarboxylase family protein [Nonomuraea bangladeshensis]|uniref:carboxymuconolactone decarboxylase family protein n=1 Tax=Nonomuraea bangladeshensis TaxID=404385 RepID=UPI0031D98162